MADKACEDEQSVWETFEPKIADLQSRIEIAKEKLWSCRNEYLSDGVKKAEKDVQRFEEKKKKGVDAAWRKYNKVWGAHSH